MTRQLVSIIGCGSFSERHLASFLKTGRVQVTSCNTNPALHWRLPDTSTVSVAVDWETALILPGLEIEDAVDVSARLGATMVNYAMNRFQATNEASLQLNAALGSVKIELHKQRWRTFGERNSAWTWHHLPAVECDTNFFSRAHSFLDQLEGQLSRLCSLEAAAPILHFNLSALVSAEFGDREPCTATHA